MHKSNPQYASDDGEKKIIKMKQNKMRKKKKKILEEIGLLCVELLSTLEGYVSLSMSLWLFSRLTWPVLYCQKLHNKNHDDHINV